MSQLARAHSAVELSALNLRGHLDTLDDLPESRARAAEEVALKRQRLDGLVIAERILAALVPHEDALREWLRNRGKD
jgi:hypothetical protein